MADLSRRAGDALRALGLALDRFPGLQIVRRRDGARFRVVLAGDASECVYGTCEWINVNDGELLDPDTDDPLTVFGLLLLAREAWGEPGLFCRPTIGRTGWLVMHTDVTLHDWRGATEAEAIVAALEAAVEAGRG